VLEAARAAPGAIFIDAAFHDDDDDDDDDKGALEPRCDLSAWFVDLARKATRASDIVRACPEYEKPQPRGR
jgi:hypothetical protein